MPLEPAAVAGVASRLAALLTLGGPGLSDPTHGDLIFESELELHPLSRGTAPGEVWAVDGGQALVADARSLQLYVTRAARVRWRAGVCDRENEGELRAHLLGCGEERHALAALGSPVAPGASVDVNLLRDWGEWQAVEASVEEAAPGSLLLVDGDLQADWRIPASWLADLFGRAALRRVLLVGVVKHSSLARGGAPLLGQLERDAEARFGARGCWWVPVAHTRPDIGAGLQVLVARLDPDAPFSFRVDLPADADAAGTLASLSSLCDDAAFPGYPYPLTVADRLASCPSWVRQDVWDQVQAVFDQVGVPPDVRDRAFSDRHRLMERA
ncbi:MAG: DNA double-strand break repair nuclease NurA [Acidimicrobiales bacterium]